MPVTIKSSQVKVKGTDGYVGVDALADSTTASRVAAITSAGADVLEDIQELGTTTEEAVAQAAAAARASIPGEYTQLSDDVTELKSALENVEDAVFSESTIILSNNEFYSENGGTVNMDLDVAIAKDTVCNVEITLDSQHQQAANCALYWRNSGGNANAIGTISKDATSALFENVVPNADATMIRFNTTTAGATYSIKVSTKNVENNVLKNTNELIDTNARINVIGEKTPIASIMSFKHGYWNTVDGYKTSVQYRVGCDLGITFNKNITICALNGLAMSGFIGDEYFSTFGTIEVPANTELKLFIRRVWENTSEIANIAEFITGIYVLNYNPSTEYDKYSNTFAGLEMFRTAGFIGDSYTATRLGFSWVDIVQNITGVICTKYAKSGADSGTWISAQTYGLPALLADTPKDVYWLALGINDGDRVDNDASYLGSVTDLSGSYEDYPDTFWGNTGHIIEAIQAYAPSAKIVMYKPIFTSVLRTLSGASATSNGINLVRNAIGEIAEHYNLPVMDALDDVLYQSNWYRTHMDSAVSAGTHPAVMLYPAIARANLRLLSKCVLEYGDYFADLNYTE